RLFCARHQLDEEHRRHAVGPQIRVRAFWSDRPVHTYQRGLRMKTFLRGLSFVAAAFLLAPLVVYGQGIPGGISGIVVSAPQLIFISGQQMQLEAVARDGQGNPRTADKSTFRSSNPAVV